MLVAIILTFVDTTPAVLCCMVLGTAAKSVEVKSKNENIKNVKRHKRL